MSEYDGDPEDEDFDGTLVDVMEWGDLGEFPHEGEGLGGAIRKWQMEDTFMVREGKEFTTKHKGNCLCKVFRKPELSMSML